MLRVTPLEAGMLHRLAVQETQKLELRSLNFTEKDFEELCNGLGGAAQCSETGQILAVAGLYPIDPNRYTAWAIFSQNVGVGMVPVVRAMREALTVPQRVEAYCQYDFSEAHRLLKLLGFVCEAPLLKNFYGKEKHATLYARA